MQLPVYNERHVVVRLIDAVAQLDWPADRLQVQVLDDSTDDTSQLIAATVAKYQASGLQVEQIQRCDRTGYKAGALQVGLEQSEADFIAIFDADFIPTPNFFAGNHPLFPTSGGGLRANLLGPCQSR